MAVKKNARREIAASINKTAGNCWEDSGNCWDRKTAPLDFSTKTHAFWRGLRFLDYYFLIAKAVRKKCNMIGEQNIACYVTL